MNQLAKQKCIPCQGGVAPLKGDMIKPMLSQLDPGWKIVEEHHLEKEYTFQSFRENLEFVNRVGGLAEAEGHHPEIYMQFRKTTIYIWTHKIDGLVESDFILAAKIDQLIPKG